MLLRRCLYFLLAGGNDARRNKHESFFSLEQNNRDRQSHIGSLPSTALTLTLSRRERGRSETPLMPPPCCARPRVRLAARRK